MIHYRTLFYSFCSLIDFCMSINFSVLVIILYTIRERNSQEKPSYVIVYQRFFCIAYILIWMYIIRLLFLLILLPNLQRKIFIFNFFSVYFFVFFSLSLFFSPYFYSSFFASPLLHPLTSDRPVLNSTVVFYERIVRKESGALHATKEYREL